MHIRTPLTKEDRARLASYARHDEPGYWDDNDDEQPQPAVARSAPDLGDAVLALLERDGL